MKNLLLFIAFLALQAQSPVLTTIVGPIFTSTGNPYSGSFTVQAQAKTNTGYAITGQPAQTVIVQGGAIQAFSLVPNDNSTPNLTSYRVQFANGDLWICIVPTSATPIPFTQACSPNATPPNTSTPISLSQIIPGSTNGTIATVVNGIATWAPCVNCNSSINPVNYSFAPQIPGGGLIANTPNAILLSPVPLGVNGTNTNYAVLLSGGFGATEPCPVTGGTAVSGAASGTIICIPANNHSGTWTVGSATAGIDEANWYTGNLGNIAITMPAGLYTIYAKPVLPAHVCFQGSGPGATTINQATATSGGFEFYLPQDGCFRNLSLTAGGVNSTSINGSSAAGILLNGNGASGTGFDISNVVIKNYNIGIDCEGCLDSVIKGFTVIYSKTNGIKINGTVHVSDGVINNAGASDLPATSSGAGLFLVDGGGSTVSGVDITGMPRGVVIQPLANVAINSTFFVNVLADTSDYDGWVFDNSNTGAVIGDVGLTNCWSSNNGQAGGASYGVVMQGTSARFNNIQFTGGFYRLNAAGAFNFLAGNNFKITGVQTPFNGTLSPGTYADVNIAAGVSYFDIEDSTFGNSGYTNPGSPADILTGINIASGGSDNYTIANNHFVSVTNPIIDGGTGTTKRVEYNLGVDETHPTVASTAALPLPIQKDFYLSGTATVTSVTGTNLWLDKTGTFVPTGAVTFTTGSGVRPSCTVTPYKPYTYWWDGTNFYFSGSGC